MISGNDLTRVSSCTSGPHLRFDSAPLCSWHSAFIAVAIVVSTFIGAPALAQSRSFYIDFSGGDNSSSGASKATPWTHAPGMPGCSATCATIVPAAGDRYIFKGGVTWDYGALPLKVAASGSADNTIYYGIDPAWSSGTNTGKVATNGTMVTWLSGQAFQANGAWDGGTIILNGLSYTIASVQTPFSLTLTSSAGIQASVQYLNNLFKRPIFDVVGLKDSLIDVTASYITIDGFDLTGQMSAGQSGASLRITATRGHVRLTNLDVHNWNRCTGKNMPTRFCVIPLTDNSWSGGGIYVAMYKGLSGTGVELRQSNVGNPENGGNLGACTRGIQVLVGNHLHNCSQACLHGCQLVRDNVVRHIGNTFDGTTHTNVFYSDGFDGQFANALADASAYIYNNWIVDVQGHASAAILYPNPGTSGATSSVTYYVFNNVISCSVPSACVGFEGINVDPYGASASLQMRVFAWNNNMNLRGSGICANATNRTYPLAVFDVRNQHCIIPSGGSSFQPGTTISPFNSNLLLQDLSTANSQGYASPTWEPTKHVGATVGLGLNLSGYCVGELQALCSSTTLGGIRAPTPRPKFGAWDIGAFVSRQGPAAPMNLRILP